MIRITVELVSAVSPERSRVLGMMEISNDGTGTREVGNYNGRLVAEYTGPHGRRGRVMRFSRQGQSVWTLIGAFLKLWGHAKHPQRDMSQE